ncbi:MAG: hypothetical protein K6G22_14980, partial [Lachnospiraceae bacterium]|nr:hypothetical protein [Lachnospiraceae bacterium]
MLIEEYNEDEDLKSCSKHLEDMGLLVCTSEDELSDKDVMSTFVFTDNRKTADTVKDKGFGFSSYYNAANRDEMFNDCLYNVDSICLLSKQQINRMLLRFLGIPWVILETDR